MSTKGERLNRAVAFLKGQQCVKTQKDIAVRMNMDANTISRALQENETYLTDSFINKFCAAFPQINANWMLKGEGDMQNNLHHADMYQQNCNFDRTNFVRGNMTQNDIPFIMEHYNKLYDVTMEKNTHMERVFCSLEEAVRAKDEQLRNKDAQLRAKDEQISIMQRHIDALMEKLLPKI